MSNRVSVSGQESLVSAYGYENDAVGRRTERLDAVSGRERLDEQTGILYAAVQIGGA